MTDYEYDILEKKRTARSATKRKCGAKSKKCTLPFETMTKKEINAMSGPVIKYNKNHLISWNNLSALPDKEFGEYLDMVVSKYKTNGRELAKVYGISYSSFNRIKVQKNYTRSRRGRVIYRSDELEIEWQKFIGTYVDKEPEIVAPPIDIQTPEKENVEVPEPEPKHHTPNVFTSMTFSMRYDGFPVSQIDIVNRMRSILGFEFDHRNCVVTVTIKEV